MFAAVDFIARLDLAHDAGERDVRRAYARALKQIDQEHDLEGFQHLRQCYEAALHWVHHRDAHDGTKDAAEDGTESGAEDDPRVVPDASAPDGLADPDSPRGLAAAVFDEFHGRFPSLATRRDNAPLDEDERLARWNTALRDTLADPRLLNLDACRLFEQRIVELLAGGWQPCHHLLFRAADTVFGWSEDGHALERFGYPGDVLAAAIEQREMYRCQEMKQRVDQRYLLALLRDGTPPDRRKIKRYIIALRTLDTYFPDMLDVTAPRDALPEWRRLGAALSPGTLAGMASAQRQNTDSDTPRLVFVALLILSLTMQARFGGPQGTDTHPPPAHVETTPTAPEPPDARKAEWTGVERTIEDVTPTEALDGARIAHAGLRAIWHGVDASYRPTPGVAYPAGQIVDVQVRLAANGEVVEFKRLVSPADPALADAFEQAIRDTGPFPPETTRQLRLRYRIEPASR